MSSRENTSRIQLKPRFRMVVTISVTFLTCSAFAVYIEKRRVLIMTTDFRILT